MMRSRMCTVVSSFGALIPEAVRSEMRTVYSRLLVFLMLPIFLVSESGCAVGSGELVLKLDDGFVNSTKRPENFSSGCESNIFPATGDTCRVVDVPPVGGVNVRKPEVRAGSVVLMDVESGQIIYSKNPHTRRPNASTTKIMTAILLIEHCRMTDRIRVSKKACETPYTSIHLKPGEELTAKDLLMGMMVRSANDAAVAIAEHIAGSTNEFAELMNRKAREIGCKNTHFVTPNGLHHKNHYSTAYDLCLMFRYALRYPVFREAINTRKYLLESRTINRKDLAVFSRCRFLRDYPWADGAKSGYIKQAGYCLVGTALRDGWRLICAVLKSDNAGRDMAAVMDYGFSNFRPYVVAQAGIPCAQVAVKGGSLPDVSVMPVRDVRVIVPKSGARVTVRIKPTELKAPVGKGVSAGKMIVYVNGSPVVGAELRTVHDVGTSFAQKLWWWTRTGGLMAIVIFAGRYGAAFTKNTRSRRNRFSAPLRKPYRFR
ncbi:MAG: D-alanyl-D-alanine carboxypeptidase family protein [Armatimonadota bacterium]